MEVLSWSSSNISKIAQRLQTKQVLVLPTDTLYGIVATALDTATVERVYQLKGRTPTKPFIILIGNITDLNKFGITPTPWQQGQLETYWPGPVSIILSCNASELAYLHRGAKSLAFRIPDNKLLRQLLGQTGPLIAPSANPEGLQPSYNITTAYSYFDKKIDLYVDAGVKNSPPSTLISLLRDQTVVLRGQLPTVH